MVLTVLVEVCDEVLLALELPRELLRMHEAQGSLFALNRVFGFHLKNRCNFEVIIRRLNCQNNLIALYCRIVRV